MRDRQWRQIWLRKIAAIVGLFLRPLGHRHAAVFDPPPGLLFDTPGAVENIELPSLLEAQSPLDGAKRVHIFHFDLGAERTVDLAYGDIGIAAESPLFHVSGGDADIAQNLPQRGEIIPRLF